MCSFLYRHLPPFTSLLCFYRLFHTLLSSSSKAFLNLSQSESSREVVTSEPPNNSLIKSLCKARKFLQSHFLFKNVHQLTSSSNVDPSSFPSLIQSCARIFHFDSGKGLHGYLIKCGFMSYIDINTSLIELYLKFGENGNAHQMFEETPSRDKVFYDSVVCGFGSAFLFEDVLNVLQKMLAFGFFPCLESFRCAIVACGELRRLDKGRWLHNVVVRNGLDKNVLICNSLISMYIKMGELDLARCTLNAMEERDVVSWNSLITGYAQSGNWVESFNIFLAMKEYMDVIHHSVTFLGLAIACGQAGNLGQGKSIHGHCIRAGLLCDFRLGTAILHMYAKCGSIECAEMLFEEGIFIKSLVSWNSLISGYSKSGYYNKAVTLFEKMCMNSNVKPDSITLANVIPAYSGLGRIWEIRLIHTLILKKGLDLVTDIVLGTAMVDAYGKCSDIRAAENLFSCIREADSPTWNAMIRAYYLNNNPDKGMLLLRKMLQNHVLPDAITIVLLLQMCGQLGSIKLGSMAHGYSLTKGFSSHLMVDNAKLDMYMRCKSLENSEQLFRLMYVKNIVTWNTMLFGYVKMGSYSSTMRVFSQMQLESVCRPDSVTFMCLIHASSALFNVHGTGVVHAFVLKLGLHGETIVMNSLIDAYAKNGIISNANSLFLNMGQVRDRCSWNIMIAGYGMNGQGEKACKLLNRMNEDGYEPDSITFTSLLTACAYSGMIKEGCQYFDLMVKKYNIHPDLEHWTCIIDMFGRAGRLEEAYQLVTSSLSHSLSFVTPSDCDAIWGAFLNACRMYKNVELGEVAGRKLLELSPQNSGYPILLSNLYASIMRWDDAENIRRVFNDGSLVKEAGFSSVKNAMG